MFILARLMNTVKIEPRFFDKSVQEAVVYELNRTFCNKVVYKLGLCIRLFDIIELGDPYVFPGEGAYQINVTFRFVVFRPFIDELIVGEVKKCTLEGVNVSVGFFDDILIPSKNLQAPSEFDAKNNVWVWKYEADDAVHDLYMDVGEKLKFRVTDEVFIDLAPSGPVDASSKTNEMSKETRSPYSILGTINESGLGLLSWWSDV